MASHVRQNGGCFSKWAREKEFSALTDEEVLAIEGIYADILLPLGPEVMKRPNFPHKQTNQEHLGVGF